MNLDDIVIFGNWDFNKKPQLDSLQETTRRKYKPKNIRYLFVGESMPDGGTFFYFQNSNLYSYTKQVFLQNFDWPPKEFLNYFKSNSFYLDDLCQEPINQLAESEKRKARKAYEPSLAERIKNYNPLIIISIPKSINKNVENAIVQSGLSVKNISISFPAQGNQHKFTNELGEIIKDVIKPLFTAGKKQN